MHFLRSVVLGASALATFALAQSDALGFTKPLSDVTAGKEIEVSYKAAHINMPVKITLRKGKSEDLKTISTLTNNAVGGTFKWNPANNLVSGNDYALEIKQGNDNNYYGPFAIKGTNMPAYGGSSGSSSPSPYLPAPNSATLKNLPLMTASGSPAAHATATFSFTPSGMPTGMPHGMNVTIQGTGTGNVGPTKTQMTYVSPTITAATTASTPSQTNAAGSPSTNLGLAVGIFGLLAYLN